MDGISNNSSFRDLAKAPCYRCETTRITWTKSLQNSKVLEAMQEAMLYLCTA
ncbi:hypothetical protein PIB30_069500, partial [Stylosanthes scabra]|nr:hypothetical protein [Stylosanthes scabra]